MDSVSKDTTLVTTADALNAEWLKLDYMGARGYIEGIVRGYRNTLLTGQSYSNLTQCETIDGMSLIQSAPAETPPTTL
nr:v-type proton atpase subunit d [Quercus suber]